MHAAADAVGVSLHQLQMMVVGMSVLTVAGNIDYHSINNDYITVNIGMSVLTVAGEIVILRLILRPEIIL